MGNFIGGKFNVTPKCISSR